MSAFLFIPWRQELSAKGQISIGFALLIGLNYGANSLRWRDLERMLRSVSVELLVRLTRRELVLTAGATSACVPFGELGATESVSGDRAVRARVDDYLTRLSGFGYSGATLLARRGRVILHKGYGFANDGDRIPVSPDTIFDIGSLAKTFTAGAIMLLEERGKLRLGDSIVRFMDSVPADKQGITIAQLLSHRSGLSSEFPFKNESAEYYEEVSRDEAVHRILGTALIAEPGEKASYSNIGYVLAAAIVERAGGKPFREFIRSEIFSPLGMTGSGFWGEGLPQVTDARLARSYDETGETGNLRTRSGTTWMDLGGGEVVSTVSDLFAWMQALRNDKLLSAAARERMWSPVSGSHGLGWFIEDDGPGGKRIHHGGDYVGFGAELAYYPANDLVFANLVNRRYQILSTRYVADRVVPQLAVGHPAQAWPGQRFDLPPQWVDRPSALEGAVGNFRLDSGGDIAIAKLKDRGFVVSGRGQDAIDLLSPTSAADRALRTSSNERALALVNAALEGRRDVIAGILREGAPLEAYQAGLVGTAKGEGVGKPIGIEVIGTAPLGFPFGARQTVLHFRFEKGEDFLRLAWDKAQDRVISMGLGSRMLATMPLRASPAGGIVGWDLITGRALALRTIPGSLPALEISNTDGVKMVALRTLPSPSAAF